MESETENPAVQQSATGQSSIGNHKSQIPNKSTGPRTAEGKRRSSQNARKHGLYSNAEFFWDSAITLGEDPREFERLLKGLVRARRPADALEMALVEDIALLFWRKLHLDRAEAAVQVCNLQKHDLERRKQFVQVGREISNTSQSEVREKGLRTSLDAPGKFEQILSILDMLVDMTGKNDFSTNMQEFLRALYGVEPTLRGAGLFNSYFQLAQMEPDNPEFEDAKTLMKARLAEEISDLVQQYELFLHEHVENTRAARIAATAPSHAQWAAIIRQQNALHRQLERKIRLLEELQEKRKREEERFLDNYQASLRRDPPEGPRGGRERGARLARSLRPAGFHRRGSSRAADLERAPVCAARSPKARAFPRCQCLKAADLPKRAADLPRTQVCASPFPRCEDFPRRESSKAVDLERKATRAEAASGGGDGRSPKKILNRGNELSVLLKTKGLSHRRNSKRTPFCAAKMAFKAEKRGFLTRIPNLQRAVIPSPPFLLGGRRTCVFWGRRVAAYCGDASPGLPSGKRPGSA